MVRLLIAALAAAVLLSFAPSTQAQEPTPTAPPPLLGDVDCDGGVTSIDVALILHFDVGTIESLDSLACPDGGDVNEDGRIDPIDAALVLQYVAGLIGELPPIDPAPLPSSASGGIAIGSAEAGPGQQSTLSLEARGITSPGRGAWTIDVEYDPAVVSLVICSPGSGAVCNADFASGVLRLSGASAGGLEGDTELASLTFECGDVEGVSDLTLTARVFADATVGAPQPFDPVLTNGSITCAEELPNLVVTVIHDLNGNGQRDPEEPGVEGWGVELPAFCGSDIIFPGTGRGRSDVDGRIEFSVEGWGCMRV